MMTTPLIDWRGQAAAYIAALNAAGIPATMDPRKVNALGALLAPPDFAQTTGRGVMAAWTVWLIAPGPADTDAVYALLDRLEAARQALPGCVEAEYSTVELEPDTPARPAYRLVIAGDPL